MMTSHVDLRVEPQHTPSQNSETHNMQPWTQSRSTCALEVAHDFPQAALRNTAAQVHANTLKISAMLI